MSNSVNIKQIIAQEKAKCIADPVHFIRKYCQIQHPTKGRIPFNLYPFQESVLQQFFQNPKNIILKSRQLGISTLSAAYSLWLALFHSDKNILVVATKQGTAKNLVTKVRVMYENLPSWMKKGITESEENNKMSLRLKNGSQIAATSSAGDAGRSEALSLLILDEAAFIKGIDELWSAVQPTLSTGGHCIILSTPNGIGNFFHLQWKKAEQGKNGFSPIKLHWTVHPERGQEWRDEQTAELGEKLAAQECLGGDTIVTIRNKETGVIEDITLEDLEARL